MKEFCVKVDKRICISKKAYIIWLILIVRNGNKACRSDNNVLPKELE